MCQSSSEAIPIQRPKGQIMIDLIKITVLYKQDRNGS